MKIIRRKICLESADNPNIYDCNTDIILEEEIPENIDGYITWENLDAFYVFSHGVFRCSICQTRKGRKLVWYYDLFSKGASFKEWRKPLNLHLTVEYRETTVSIDELFKMPDNEKVIKYFLERGINFLQTS